MQKWHAETIEEAFDFRDSTASCIGGQIKGEPSQSYKHQIEGKVDTKGKAKWYYSISLLINIVICECKFDSCQFGCEINNEKS